MKTFISAIILIVVLHVNTSLSCQTNCCNSNNCCQTSSCQTSFCQESSCQTCCNTCQLKCRTQTCQDQCSENCCKPDCCSVIPTQPTPTPVVPEPKIIYVPGPVSTSDARTETRGENISNVNNDNMTTSINMNNTITNENRIYIPINISNNNYQSIHIEITPNIDLTQGENTGNYIDNTTTIVVTEKVPVLIPVPGPNRTVHVPYPVPYPVRIPSTHPGAGCCNVVTPCVGDHCSGFNRVCSQHCTSGTMFTPINPCMHGCYKKDYGLQWSCSMSGYCRQSIQDCFHCDESFYENYVSYRRCGGCFSHFGGN